MGSKPLHIRLREKRNHPPKDQPWIWLTRDLLESEAWRSLSHAGMGVVFRVMLEHMAHAGTENGNLVVTYDDFVKFGIRRQSINAAIREAIERGFIIVTVQGRASVGEARWPNRYALTWLPLKDGAPATNRWKAWTHRSSTNGN